MSAAPRRGIAVGAPLSAVVVLAAACGGGAPADSAKTGGAANAPAAGASVLLVTLDTTRADALGCYGGIDWLTPNLDALAAGGVRFASVRAPSPMTLPSHTSILSGLYPYETGVRDNAGFRVPDEVVTLPERLKAVGYSTGAVLSSFVLDPTFGLAQGVDVYVPAPRLHVEVDGLEDQRPGDQTVREALRLVREELEPPFLLWVHLFDPHMPYDVREPYYSRLMAGSSPGDLGPQEHDRRKYLSEVAFMDAQIGELLQNLRRDDADLLTVVVADHGESLGEHGETTHGALLYDSSIRIPMIFQHGSLPAGRVVAQSVSSVDVTPTVLDLLGIDVPAMTGAVLTPWIQGAQATVERPLYFESCNPYYACGWSPLYGVLLGEYKFIEGPDPQLYRVGEDPSELRDVSGEHGDLLSEGRSLFGELAPATARTAHLEIGAEELKELQALGYLGGSGTAAEVDPLKPGYLDPAWKDPALGMPVLGRFRKAFKASSPAELVSTVREILALEPDNPYFLTYATTAFMSVGQPREALRTARRSLELRDTPSTRCYEAVALNALGRKDDALAALELNVQLHPYHLHTRVALAQLLMEARRNEEALVHIDFFLESHAAEDDWHRTVEGWKQRAERAAGGQ